MYAQTRYKVRFLDQVMLLLTDKKYIGVKTKIARGVVFPWLTSIRFS